MTRTATPAATPTKPARAGSEYRVVDSLNEEWRTLIDDADADGLARRWATQHRALGGCDGLASVLERVARRPDAVLGALIALDRDGDPLAGRVVLQAMLGKLVRMAQRDAAAGVDDYVASLWCRIRTYPLQRRPERIAANLALDTLKAVTADRRDGSRRAHPPLLCEAAELEEAQARHHRRATLDHGADVADLDARRVIGAGLRLGLIDPTSAEVLRTVYADGLSGREAADRLGISPAMVRFRCSRSVGRLRGAAAALALAA